MIYTKSRRPSQSRDNKNTKQYDYLNQINDQNLVSNYLYKQRHSIGTVTPSQKNRTPHTHNSLNKINHKKYDYSLNISQEFDNNHNKSYYQGDKKYLNTNQRYMNKGFESYNYKNSQYETVERQLAQQNHNKRYSVTKLPSQKIDIKKFLQMNDQNYKSNNKKQTINQKRHYQISYQLNSNNKNNHNHQQITSKNINNNNEQKYSHNTRYNNVNDNFYFTDKFKQFQQNSKIMNQLTNKKIQSSIGKAKYQSRYNRMKSKPYDIEIKKGFQQQKKQQNRKKALFDNTRQINRNERQVWKCGKENNNKNKQQRQHQRKTIERQIQPQRQHIQKQIFIQSPNQNNLQLSQQQNQKIKQKINRISQLNQEINIKLQNMLLKRNII